MCVVSIHMYSSGALIVIPGIILSTMLTIVSFDYIPHSFWGLPFWIIVSGVFLVFTAWITVFGALVNIVEKR